MSERVTGIPSGFALSEFVDPMGIILATFLMLSNADCPLSQFWTKPVSLYRFFNDVNGFFLVAVVVLLASDSNTACQQLSRWTCSADFETELGRDVLQVGFSTKQKYSQPESGTDYAKGTKLRHYPRLAFILLQGHTRDGERSCERDRSCPC
jgi:hypothetical protein